MAHTSKNTLLDIETPVLNACKDVLTNNNITTCFLNRDTGSLSTPRVELQYVVGQPIGSYYISSSVAEYNAWNCQLTALVVTDRATNPTSHSRYVATVRNLLGDYRNINNQTTSMPHHMIVKSNNVNTQVTIEGNLDLDLSAVVFDQVVYIRPDAW